MKSLQIIDNKLEWDDKVRLPLVKQLFAPDVSDLEFMFFVDLARVNHLNPFKKEIWATKIDKSKPAQVFIGINGYRAIAHRNPDYEYHLADAVYSKDEFLIVDGLVTHTYNFADRGVLKGAYCKVKRKSSCMPMFVFVDIQEYNQNQFLWLKKPATMIKKVAEAAALRQCFSELNGTYIEEEIPPNQKDNVVQITETHTQTEKLKNIINVHVETGEVIEEKATHEQIGAILDLIDSKELSNERIQKALEYYKVQDFSELTSQKAELFIQNLRRI